MKTRPWFIYVFVVVLLASCTISPTIAQPLDSQHQARRILDSCDVRGGLIVHIGCGDGELTAALRASDCYIVQGLDTDADNVEEARSVILSKGLYGKVTARQFNGRNLPYIGNLVNLVVVSGKCQVSEDEIMRVLAPRGVAYVNGKKTVKSWPTEMDEWTHFHHNPQGTMVGKDQLVGPPRRIQWIGEPKWLRNHDFMSSMHAMVSAGGRVFYVIDEGLRNHIFLPARWTLIARDGFNGTILWKKPLADWHPNNWPLKSGPGHHPRKLVAVGDRVYVAGGLVDPVKAIDAVTGETIKTYDGTKPTQEIVLSDGVLYLLVDPEIPPVNYRAETSSYKEINRANSGWAWEQNSPQRIIMTFDAGSGKLIWKHPAKVAPLTLTVCDDKILYHNGEGMVALDRKNGDILWSSQGPAVAKVDIIISNPPYVSEREFDKLPPAVRDWEPKEALFAEEEGLEFHGRIIAGAGSFLKCGGWLLLEIGQSQAEKISQIFTVAGIFEASDFVRDYGEIERVARVRRKSNAV